MATPSTTTNWKIITFGEACKFTSKPRRLKLPEEIPFIPMEAISETNNIIDQNLIKKVKTVSSGTYVENGDLLLAKITPSLENGKQGFVDLDSSFGYATTEVIPIQAITDISDKCFLSYWLKQSDVRSILAGKMEGTTGRQRLSKAVLADTQILLPPIEQQKAIARVLTTVQGAIAGQEALIAKLKELKRSMMHHLFTHGTKGEKTKITEIGEMPESWDVVQLKEVCDKPQYGFTDSAAPTGNVRFLRITDITEDGVDWTAVPYCSCPEPAKYLLKDGDIVFARIGATTGKSYFLKKPDNAVYASYLIRVRATKINSEYLYYFFQTDAYWKQINSQKGTNLKGGVNGSILSQLLVPKCEGQEQVIIANIFESIDAKIVAVQSKLSTYQSLFKTLLHELMSGERRMKIT